MKLTGVAATPGIVVGPIFVYQPREDASANERITEAQVSDELALLEGQVGRLVEKLEENRERLRMEGLEETARILEAHEELAQDPEITNAAEKARGLASACAATLRAGEEFTESSGEDVGLAGLEEPSVILANALIPSETARLEKDLALGFVTATGSKTSHISIMARSEGISVSVCGEAAGDPEIVPKLIEAGATELSMSPPAIPRSKKLVSEL